MSRILRSVTNTVKTWWIAKTRTTYAAVPNRTWLNSNHAISLTEGRRRPQYGNLPRWITTITNETTNFVTPLRQRMKTSSTTRKQKCKFSHHHNIYIFLNAFFNSVFFNLVCLFLLFVLFITAAVRDDEIVWRVINEWNNLPTKIQCASTLNEFKRGYDKHVHNFIWKS